MQCPSAAARGLAVSILLLCLSGTGSAFEGVFKGMLIPNTVSDSPIPIVVELEEASGRFSGTVKTSPPFMGQGDILSGERRGDYCDVTTKIGESMRLRLEGPCRSSSFDGKYNLYLREGEHHQGAFRLNRDRVAEKKKKPSDQDKQKRAVSMTSCIRSNAQCLALCPRTEYNAEFVCVNGCRRKFTTCKARAKDARMPPPEAFD
jgi:hypothetical protein